ncbi:MAG: hypothetical protein PHN18_10315 [Sulfurospirillaceae bacterium]|nr:hypothetical protein [Sulfurospirillaceae bacterium]MDD2827467.1 hypothetical protein [Sulfurospirillaceae bacterium]
MTKETYKKYLLLLGKIEYVEVFGKNIRIRGEKYWVRKYNLPCLVDALIQTSHLPNITCKTVLELTDAIYKAKVSWKFYCVKNKSEEAIKLFLELVKTPNSDLEARLFKELKTAA